MCGESSIVANLIASGYTHEPEAIVKIANNKYRSLKQKITGRARSFEGLANPKGGTPVATAVLSNIFPQSAKGKFVVTPTLYIPCSTPELLMRNWEMR